jgi:type IX secretion system substrate protein/VCBS repeat protein
MNTNIPLLSILILISFSSLAQTFLEGDHFPGTFPTSAAFGDLNDDGHIDMIQGVAQSENPSPLNASKIWLNNGDSTFTLYDEVGTRKTNDVELVDIDNDGDLDIVEANEVVHQLWLNDGLANFTAGQFFGIGDASSLAIADYNEDGFPDIFFGNQELGTSDLLYMSLGNGQFELVGIPWTSGSRTRDCEAVDINMDDHMDIVMSKSMVGVPSLMENEVWFGNGDGTFIKSVQMFPLTGSWELDVMDWNDDGFLDLIFSEDGGIYIYYGDGSFIYNQRTLLFTDPIIRDYDFVDIDVDGDLDLVIGRPAGTNGYKSEIFYNDGDGNFTDGTEEYSMEETVEVEPYDIDQDNDIDLLNININSQNSVLWMNQTDPPLSIDDINSSQIVFYPNPVQDVLFIEAQEQIENIKIYTLQGNLIKEATLVNEVNVSELSSGMYFIQLSGEGKTVTKKFIKE